MTTLYKHRIYSLHGQIGTLDGQVAQGGTTLTLQAGQVSAALLSGLATGGALVCDGHVLSVSAADGGANAITLTAGTPAIIADAEVVWLAFGTLDGAVSAGATAITLHAGEVAAGVEQGLRAPSNELGSNIYVGDHEVTITNIDGDTLSITPLPGAAGDGAAVRRTPHWAYVWNEDPETPITVSPENSAHIISPNSWSVVDEMSPNTVSVNQSRANHSHLGLDHIAFDVAPGATQTIVFAVPHDITLGALTVFCERTNWEDRLTVEAAPNFALGASGIAVGSGATEIPVNAVALSMLQVGYYVKLVDNGGNPADTNDYNALGRVLAVNKATSTVTVETATARAFAADAYIAQTIVFTRDMRMPTSTSLEITAPFSVGAEHIKGTLIQANIPVVCSYTADIANGQNARLLVHIEYLY